MAVAPIPETEGRDRRLTWLVATAVVAAASLAVTIDMVLPAGPADWLGYLGLVLLGWWLRRPGEILLLAGLATLLMALGHMASVGMDNAAMANSALAAAAVWATAGVLAAAKRRCQSLHQRVSNLHARVRRESAHASALRTQSELTNRMASDLLSGMSHELRTPLNAIIGFTEVVRTEMFGPIGSERYRAYLKDIHDSGRHLLALINNLLDVARIEAGPVQMADQSVDMAAIIRACLAEVAVLARERRLDLVCDVADDLAQIRGDRRMLRQIVRNLLANALEFTPGGGQIRVAAWCRADSGCVVQIADTGRGMVLEDIPEALAPFGQRPRKNRQRYRSGGLGLPLSKALVELHAGSLDLQSEPGAGTTVTIRLPARRLHALPAVA